MPPPIALAALQLGEVAHQQSDQRYVSRFPLGDLFGLQNFGVNISYLPPNAISSLRHAHDKQDEFIYVIQGDPTLISNEGETLLHAGDCAGFLHGTGNAHHLVNRSNQIAIILEIGDRTANDQAIYPDNTSDEVRAALGG